MARFFLFLCANKLIYVKLLYIFFYKKSTFPRSLNWCQSYLKEMVCNCPGPCMHAPMHGVTVFFIKRIYPAYIENDYKITVLITGIISLYYQSGIIVYLWSIHRSTLLSPSCPIALVAGQFWRCMHRPPPFRSHTHVRRLAMHQCMHVSCAAMPCMDR
jgi:hypothetical protein